MSGSLWLLGNCLLHAEIRTGLLSGRLPSLLQQEPTFRGRHQPQGRSRLSLPNGALNQAAQHEEGQVGRGWPAGQILTSRVVAAWVPVKTRGKQHRLQQA